MIPKVEIAQRDFSAGELDVNAKRGDDTPELRAGCRQASNWRIRNSRGLSNRSGRTVQYLASGRNEEVTISPGLVFRLSFGVGTLRVYNSAGAQVFTQAGFPWVLATVGQIDWDVYRQQIFICFPGMVPQVLSWDGVATWSVAAYAEQVIAGQKRTPFYRISPLAISLQPSAQSGNINLVFSAGMNLTAGHVGTRISFCGRQILITGVTNATTGAGTVLESLPSGELFGFAVDPKLQFQVGDLIEGSVTGAQGVVTSFPGGNQMIVQLLTRTNFITTDVFASTSGKIFGASSVAAITPQPTTVWDDEVMNTLRGYPQSVFVDQNRVGFCNFPGVPGGIAWSAITSPTDLFVGSDPNAAMFELAPGKSQVLYVVPGQESSEFVFCDNGLYYIPISVTNPLKPGSVAFNLLTRDGCGPIKPRAVQEVILFINSGLTSVMSVLAPGAYYRPFEVRNVSTLHAHTIKTPVAIAVPNATGLFEERYAYVLNSDGTLAVGKYEVENGQIKGVVGWLPWSGAGVVSWLSARGSNVLFTTTYAPNAIAPVSVVELLDDTQYLDGAMMVNAAPAALAPPGGNGPLWWLAGGTVYLIDLGTRFMDTYVVDANGFIVPQNVDGENLASAQLVAGQPWTATFEPFLPAAQPGQDEQQRMRKRKVSRAQIYVQNSSGFSFAGRRIEAWNIGEDPAQAAPLREKSYLFRTRGRSHDPRYTLVKDTPGPLTILEASLEVTV